MQIRSKQFFTRTLALLMSVLICFTTIPLTAFGGSLLPNDLQQKIGSYGTGDSNNHWIEFTNGARLTAISSKDGSVASRSIDWVEDLLPTANVGNKHDYDYFENYKSQIYSFGKKVNGVVEPVCKQDYKQDYEQGKATLNRHSASYTYKTPPAGMPKIISDKGSTIDAIREYFADRSTVQSFCANVYDVDGINYSSSPEAQALYARFTSGELLLAVEPIAFFYWIGDVYAATPTEIALLDIQTDAALRPYGCHLLGKLAPLTHENAPNAIFLGDVHENLGYPKPKPAPSIYTGSGKLRYYASNDIIVRGLGIGIIWLTPDDATVCHHICNIKLNIPKNAPDFTIYNYDPKTQTDIITGKVKMTSAVARDMLLGKAIYDTEGKQVQTNLATVSGFLDYCIDNGYAQPGLSK